MTSFTYNPTNFYRSTYESPVGQAIWAFLQTSESLLVMSVADHLRRPAIEGITPFLKERFGAELDSHLLKRTIGNMVGAIQRQRGKVVRSYTKLKDSSVFDRGAVWIDAA